MTFDASGTTQLHRPGSYPGTAAYWRKAWLMRHFAAALARGSVRAGHQGRALGWGWQFLEPLLEIAVYWIIFGLILDVSRGIDNFIAFLTVGRITYGFLQRSLTGAAGSVTAQVPMLRALAFPRVVVPVADWLRSLILLRGELVVLAVAITLMSEPPRWSWLLFPPLMAFAALFSLGVGAALARFVFRLPDLDVLIRHLLRLNLYASGVVFPLDRFLDSPDLQRVATLNPFLAFIDLSRWSALGMRPAHPGLALTVAGVAGVIAVGGGFAIFVRGEHEFASTRNRAGGHG